MNENRVVVRSALTGSRLTMRVDESTTAGDVAEMAAIAWELGDGCMIRRTGTLRLIRGGQPVEPGATYVLYPDPTGGATIAAPRAMCCMAEEDDITFSDLYVMWASLVMGEYTGPVPLRMLVKMSSDFSPGVRWAVVQFQGDRLPDATLERLSSDPSPSVRRAALAWVARRK